MKIQTSVGTVFVRIQLVVLFARVMKDTNYQEIILVKVMDISSLSHYISNGLCLSILFALFCRLFWLKIYMSV